MWLVVIGRAVGLVKHSGVRDVAVSVLSIVLWFNMTSEP